MGGRASTIMVMGFVVLLSFQITSMSRRSTLAVENAVDDYMRMTAHQIAVSGMNIAASKLYQDFDWRTGFNNVPFQEGMLSVSFGSSGDTIEVYSVSTYRTIVDTVKAYFTGSSIYTDFAAFTGNENGCAWAPGDTIWGPIHTNGRLNHQNNSSIVFMGKVTAGQGISAPPKNAKTKFLGGYEVGVFLPEVNNMTGLIASSLGGGYVFPTFTDTLKLEFLSTGNIIVYRNSTVVYADPGVPLTSIAPNGVIYSLGPIEILGGTVNTHATGVSIGSGKDIIFRDEVNYLDDPESNPNSDDMIAFIAKDNIYFDNGTKSDWYMQCILMAVSGSLTATNMTKNGSFDYYGSYYQANRGNAKMFHSFNKKYKYDLRLHNKKPPSYPGLSNLALVAWWE